MASWTSGLTSVFILILQKSDTVHLAADIHITDNKSPLGFSFFLYFLPYGTKAALFVILLLFIVFSAAYKSPRLLPCLSPRTLQVCLWSGQTMMTIVKSCLLGWMAGLICSMQATGWQQHMCWWQPHTGQFLAQYNTFHCTPVAYLGVYNV